MTRTLERPSAARLTFQIAAAGALVSIIAGGCSSEVKTVSVEECAGVPASGGHRSGSAGAHSSMGGSTDSIEMAGEGGIGPSEGSGGTSGSSGNGGNGGTLSVSGSGGISGSGGMASGAGSGGKGSGGAAGKGSGGSGGKASGGGLGGKADSGGASNNGGSSSAVCGDAVVTPPEFCDDRTNTDLSYGCSACTTLPPSQADANPQCSACLQAANKPTTCYACDDHRACYACLRRQPDSFPGASHCSDIAPDTETETYPYTARGLSDLCFNPNSPLYQAATGGPAGNKPRGLVCQALLACALRTRCATDANSMFSKCYCGASATENCADPAFVPKGPCVQEMIDADAPGPSTTGSALAIEIGSHFDLDFGNPWVVLPVARQIANCANDNLGCAEVCFPESSNSGGSGGSGASGGKSGAGGKAGTGGS